MNWSNVKLILAREIRDQLRDRRTMFMIVVLPILLYPLLGMTFFQISQFVREVPTRVLVVGAKNLPEQPALFENGRFVTPPGGDAGKGKFLEPRFAGDAPPGDPGAADGFRAAVRAAIKSNEYEAALVIPRDFRARLHTFRQAVRQGTRGAALPKPEIIYSSAKEKSQITSLRLKEVLRRWSDDLGKATLASVGVPDWAVADLDVETVDLAQATGFRGAAVWSRVLPVLLMIWALTGAFYPAVDLCAGEKERGTLETLLSSPAQRSEIVVGKLVTIMLFSGVTAILNLASIAMMGSVMLKQLPGFGPPPAASAIWLCLALLPASALFSALCLALAAFARSTKEGQYYLMPLLLITMPLAILPVTAGLELTLGNSMIPVTGLVLLLRAALEGNYWQVFEYFAPVVLVTLGACLLAIRWAVDQFNSESVLFRESERLDLGLWLRHMLQERGPTPSPAVAVFCGVVILFIHFFMNLAARPFTDLRGFAILQLVTQLTTVLTPVLLMTVVLTTSPRRTLLLRWPRWWAVPGAALLAVVLHPAASVLESIVLRLYPLGEEMQRALKEIEGILGASPWWLIVLVMAAMPAVCEELAFRGFILSGLRRVGSPWRAVVLSAVFFGLSHGILQQSLIASLVGVLLGWLAVWSGSILPGMTFHLVHNSLVLLTARIPGSPVAEWPIVSYLCRPAEDGGFAFRYPVVLAGLLAGVLILFWFARHGDGLRASHALPGEPGEEPSRESISVGLPADV
jgi:sodium transport system permease protein